MGLKRQLQTGVMLRRGIRSLFVQLEPFESIPIGHCQEVNGNVREFLRMWEAKHRYYICTGSNDQMNNCTISVK